MPSTLDIASPRGAARVRMRDLHLFLTTSELGSMAQAAYRLGITQPAISQAIGALEHDVGARLLDRTPRGVTVTPFGEILRRRAAAVFGELRLAATEIDALRDPTAGEVRVGCNDSLSVVLLPEAIRALIKTRRRAQVRILQTSRPITVEVQHLRDRSVDLIVGRGVFRIPEDDVATEILFEESLVAISGVTSAWARRKRISLADLVDERWILNPPEEAPGSFVHEAFDRHGLREPHATVTGTSFHLRQVMLASGEYLTVVPTCMVSLFNASGCPVKVLPVDLAIPSRAVAIFTLKNRTLNPMAERFAGELRRVANLYAERGKTSVLRHKRTSKP